MKKISIISLITIIIDRIVKVLVSIFLKLNVRYTIIKNFFYLTYCQNEGAAFSIFYGKQFFIIIISIIILSIIFYALKKKVMFTKLDYISYGLFIGGIIGNLIDRVFLNYVIDYFDFQIFNYNFAIFNIADIAIVVSAFLLILFQKE